MVKYFKTNCKKEDAMWRLKNSLDTFIDLENCHNPSKLLSKASKALFTVEIAEFDYPGFYQTFREFNFSTA